MLFASDEAPAHAAVFATRFCVWYSNGGARLKILATRRRPAMPGAPGVQPGTPRRNSRGASESLGVNVKTLPYTQKLFATVSRRLSSDGRLYGVRYGAIDANLHSSDVLIFFGDFDFLGSSSWPLTACILPYHFENGR